jgi:anti-sigma factor RsiW
MLHWAKEPPKPAGAVMHADRADPREDHRTGMTFTNPDCERAALASLVPEPQAVTTPALAPGLGKPDSAALTHAGLGIAVSGKCPTEVDRSFLEHLRRYRL